VAQGLTIFIHHSKEQEQNKKEKKRRKKTKKRKVSIFITPNKAADCSGI